MTLLCLSIDVYSIMQLIKRPFSNHNSVLWSIKKKNHSSRNTKIEILITYLYSDTGNGQSNTQSSHLSPAEITMQ